MRRSLVLLACLSAAACPTSPAPREIRVPVEDPIDVDDDDVVVLNEVACRGDDWVELGNPTDQEADVSRYVLSDAQGGVDHEYVLPEGARIPAGGYLVVARQTESADGLLFGLLCGEDSVRLYSDARVLLDEVALPVLADGQTLSRIDDLTGPFTAGAPTPGARNVAWVDESLRLFADDSTIDIAITLPETSAQALYSAPYEYVEGAVEVTAPAELATGPLDVGVRLKGVYGSFRTLDGKAAFRIDSDRLVDDQRFFGLEHFVLNNMVQDPSYAHEVLAYRVFEELDVPAPRARYARVTVNGAPFGLYLLLEAWDEASLARRFASTRHLYEGEYGADVGGGLEVDVGDPSDRADLEALLAALLAPRAQVVPALREVTDWPEMLRMWAVERFIGHWDGYVTVNNYFLHADDGGRFSMLPWGTDQTFLDRTGLLGGGGALFAACTTDPACLTEYLDVLLEVADAFEALALEGLLDDTTGRLANDIEADARREAPLEYVQDHITMTRMFIRTRAMEVRELVSASLGDADGDGAIVLVDCNDSDATIHPGADDVCGDAIDQDCDNIADNGPTCPDCDPLPLGATTIHVCRTPRSFDDAAAYCESIGTSLLVVDSAVKEQALAARGLGGYWTGYTDEAEEGVWRTVDGVEGGYLPFSPGEPNNCCGGEHCAESWGVGSWNDVNCEFAHLTLCEEPCVAEPIDADGDGIVSSATCGTDCDDARSDVFPGAPEVCSDGVDQDCNGMTDDAPGCPLPCSVVAFSGHDYAFCPHYLVSWEAEAQCEARGMTLVRVGSDGERVWLRENAGRYGVDAGWYWVDVNDNEEEGVYVDSSGTPASYLPFLSGEPNDPGGFEDCVLSFWDGWVDAPCNLGASFICEAPCDGADTDGDGADNCGEDCSVDDPTVFPGAPEICDDGLDQDCDGLADYGCPAPPTPCTPFDRDGRAYELCELWTFQAEARAQCAARGMTLLRVSDVEESNWATYTVAGSGAAGYGLWTDATDEGDEGAWRFSDGTTPAFLPWRPGQPDDPASVQDCAALSSVDGLLDDEFCGEGRPFFCEAL